MEKIFTKSPFISAAVLGFVLLTPFIALELINRAKFNEDFPWAVFAFTWILQAVFILMLMPIVVNARSGKPLMKNSVSLLLRIVILVLIAYIWTGWIVDQWPCLMGVPNCD